LWKKKEEKLEAALLLRRRDSQFLFNSLPSESDPVPPPLPVPPLFRLATLSYFYYFYIYCLFTFKQEQIIGHTGAIISQTRSDPADPALSPTANSVLRAILVPALVCLEGSPLAAARRPSLSPLAAAACRRTCIDGITRVEGFKTSIPAAFAALLGETVRHGCAMLFQHVKRGPDPVLDLPGEVLLLYHNTDPEDADEEGTKSSVPDFVKEDAYLGPLFRHRACRTCGLLPADPTQLYAFCSLCRDPAAGRFCCREPCFAKAWAAGHKSTCAGRKKK
jgi:hypothetical protein